MVNIVKVFTDGNETDAVELDRPLSIDNCILCSNDSPPLLPRQTAILREWESVLIIITRSKNSNTVVYRKSSNEPIEVFWQRFADYPDTVVDDATLREELSWIQKKMAYGINVVDDSVTLTACPDLRMTLTTDRFNIPRLQLEISGRDCYLLRIYVEARENIFGLPTVIYTNIHAVDFRTGQELVVKVKP